jgi:hypothetical protein
MSKRFRLDKSDVSGRVLDKLSLQKYAPDVVYLVSQQFSANELDEWRLPWNILGDSFWEIKKE